MAVEEMHEIQIAADRYGINYNEIISCEESGDPLFYLEN
jgi:hypothetical protein